MIKVDTTYNTCRYIIPAVYDLVKWLSVKSGTCSLQCKKKIKFLGDGKALVTLMVASLTTINPAKVQNQKSISDFFAFSSI